MAHTGQPGESNRLFPHGQCLRRIQLSSGAHGLPDGINQPPTHPAAFGSVAMSETSLTGTLIAQTLDHTLILFDKGFYALGLLHQWHTTGTERHWLLPLKKGAQYRIIATNKPGDELIELTPSSQTRKKWPDLPTTLRARLLTKTLKGKPVKILTLLLDAKRFPAADIDIVDLYAHRWEIELCCHEMNQYLLQNRLTLRSKTPALIRQELWGVLLAYSLLRFQMAYSLKSVEPNELSFTLAANYIIKELTLMPAVSLGRTPEVICYMQEMALAFVLSHRRERQYPRIVKRRSQRYPIKNASQLN